MTRQLKTKLLGARGTQLNGFSVGRRDYNEEVIINKSKDKNP